MDNKAAKKTSFWKKPGDSIAMAILSWIHVWLLFSGSYLVVAGVMNYSPRQALIYLAGSLFLLVPAVFSWFFIRTIDSLTGYLLASAGVEIFLWLVTHSIQTVTLSGMILFTRGYTRVRKGRIHKALMDMPGDTGAELSRELWEIPTFLDEPSPIHWLVFAVFYGGILFSRKTFMLPWMFYLFLGEVFVCFVHSYLFDMEDFIKENQHIANLPINRIRRVGAIILGMAVIVLCVAVLPSVFYGEEPLVGFMDRMNDRPLPPPDPEEEFSMKGPAMGQMDLGALAGEAKEPPAWVQTLSKVIMLVVFLFAGGGLLIGFCLLCKNAAGYFAQDEEDEVTFLGTDEVESIRGLFGKRKPRGDKRGSPDWKIRRLYKKLLKKRMSDTPAGWEAPAELEDKARLEGEEAGELHEIYEKARYAREGCSPEEASRAAELAGEAGKQ